MKKLNFNGNGLLYGIILSQLLKTDCYVAERFHGVWCVPGDENRKCVSVCYSIGSVYTIAVGRCGLANGADEKGIY